MGLGWLGSALGGVVSGLFGMASADRANSAQEAMSRQQHEWNVDDYRHRYQWAAEDMQKAGLNKILAATNGIGGSINGTGLGHAAVAPTPDFGAIFNSAYQTGTQKEIAKMQNEVQKEELRLREIDLNSAKEKRENDMRIDSMMADIKKWSIEEENKRAWLMNDATIENLRESLRIQEEHYQRADAAAALSAEASMAHAGAAWYSAQVQDRLADVAEKTGYTQQELNTAHKILLDTQARDAAAIAQWHEYLNKHPHVRGAVGMISGFLDVAGTSTAADRYFRTLTSGVSRDW